MSYNPQAHFDWVADHATRPRYYQRQFQAQRLALYQHHIPAGSRILEAGMAEGDLLAQLAPSRGLGLDFSAKMVAKAQQRHPEAHLEFRQADVQTATLDETFDAIILDDLCQYLDDVQLTLTQLRQAAHPRTRLYLTSFNQAWRPWLALARSLGMAVRHPVSNWLSRADLANLLALAGWEVVRCQTEQLFPFQVPLLTPLLNRFLVRMPVLWHLGSTIFIVARPRMAPVLTGAISCSVVVPARNEAGNIAAALARIPVLGQGTEVIFVEGHSRDDTWATIQREVAAYQGPHQVRMLQQPGKGKWDAVRAGFALAQGDVLVIQDGDLTAPPEDLPKFYQAVAGGQAEFANGSRLIYPMGSRAMPFLNLLANWFFARLLSYILGQPIKDSLCGTKMLLRSDYQRLLDRIRPFGDFDPFGDFNLLFGAVLLNLRLVDIPVRYQDRSYGSTNISRWRHGVLLLRMMGFGLRWLRFHR